jgi:hypothetical protein
MAVAPKPTVAHAVKSTSPYSSSYYSQTQGPIMFQEDQISEHHMATKYGTPQMHEPVVDPVAESRIIPRGWFLTTHILPE